MKLASLTKDDKIIHNIIKNNLEILGPNYFKLLSEWMNTSYEKFKDIDTYRIIIYFLNKNFENWLSKGLDENYDKFFFNKSNLELDQIIISEISKELNIPKESARRKLVNIEKFGYIKKKGKKIYLQNSLYKLAQPKNTLKNFCSFLIKILEICNNEKLIIKKINYVELSNLIKKNFVYCWHQFYRFIFAITNRWKKQLGDLEIFSVGLVIVCHSMANKFYDGDVLSFLEWSKDLEKIDSNGVNTMSISEITKIPRPTVVRKLNYLLKNKYISLNNKKQFSINMKEKALEDTFNMQEQNFKSMSICIFNIFKKIEIK
tara:strand:- start:102 stop:1052 length:951 start_codon:yes stop_codon:yes gene_type:complete